tara:strand:- start:11859 stop:12083 length:225 start_codon:yes stop_codon:yes gene_type:complete
MKKKKIRNQLLRKQVIDDDPIYRILCVNHKTLDIWVADEFTELDLAKQEIDKYTQDNVRLYIQNKNSNRIVYTR